MDIFEFWRHGFTATTWVRVPVCVPLRGNNHTSQRTPQHNHKLTAVTYKHSIAYVTAIHVHTPQVRAAIAFCMFACTMATLSLILAFVNGGKFDGVFVLVLFFILFYAAMTWAHKYTTYTLAATYVRSFCFVL